MLPKMAVKSKPQRHYKEMMMMRLCSCNCICFAVLHVSWWIMRTHKRQCWLLGYSVHDFLCAVACLTHVIGTQLHFDFFHPQLQNKRKDYVPYFEWSLVR